LSGATERAADVDSKPALSVIIPCYRRPEMLRKAVAALDDPRLEILVINRDDDPEVAEVAAPYVHLPFTGPPGPASAINYGALHASADYVVFMNDDVVVSAEGVLTLKEILESGEADVAIPEVVGPAGSLETTIVALPTPRALLREWLLLPDRPIPWLRRLLRVEKWRRPVTVETIEAAGTPLQATHTQLLRENPHREDFFFYFDEIEWLWRLHKLGKRVVYVPHVKAVHLGGAFEFPSPLKERLFVRNAARCLRQMDGRAAAAQGLVIVSLYYVRLITMAALRRAVGRARSQGELRARLAGLAGIVDGMKELL
jgi:GT2 family glycosyltransferase